MKKIFKFIGYLFAIIIVLLATAVAYIKLALPNVGKATDLKVELTQAKIDRGQYLANHVMVCIDCHSTRDWSLFSGPIVAETEGKGGEIFDEKLGFPGKYVSPNLTPYKLKSWTHGEIFRAITSGVTNKGKALFSLMPYHNYGKLDKNDIEAVIAYLRTLKPIESTQESSTSNFPVNILINTFPSKPNFTTIPNTTNTIEYGKYLTTAAGCYDCHTKQEKGKFVGDDYAGGFEFKFADGTIVRSSNITSDKATGLGSWTVEAFVNKFKVYEDSTFELPKVNPGNFQTVMPWTMYAGMKKEDLAAIFAYLQTVKAVNNTPEKFTSAKLIKN